MPTPPPDFASRHDRRRAQVRRRRLVAVGGLVALVAVVAVVAALASSGGSGHSSPQPASGGSVSDTPSGQPSGRSVALSARDNREIRRLARLGLPLYCAGPRGNEVAFTFDDGPGPYTHYALKKLREAHERATFFVVQRSINYFPGWLQRELPYGVIGDHTNTHPVLPSLSPSAIESEITGTAQTIHAQTGETVQFFRPPYGARNATVDAIARRLGLVEVLWNIDSADSLGANWQGIIHNVEAGLHPGSIILMHENRGQTIRALTTILPELRRRHLRSVSLPELLGSDPPTAAQMRAGANGCGGAVLHGSGG